MLQKLKLVFGADLADADNEQNTIQSSHANWTYSKQAFEPPCFDSVYTFCVFVLGNWGEYLFLWPESEGKTHNQTQNLSEEVLGCKWDIPA